MPARRKPIALHAIQGTYTNTRHDTRARQAKMAQALPKPICPPELPDHARNIFQWLISTYPGTCEVHTPLMAQASVLYALFLEDPAKFPIGQHNQLRLVFKELQQIAMEVEPEESESESDFRKWKNSLNRD